MQLMATGCAGILYPVYLLRKEFLDVDAVCKTCLFADDLWLKAMELLSDVPVVAARVCSELQFVPGTQEKTLQKVNVLKDQNDAQLKQIISWLDEKYEPGIFKRKLMRSDVGVALLGMEKVSHYLDQERKAFERKKRKAEDDLKAIQNAYSQANAQMKNVGEDNKVLVQKLERANRELDEKTCRLSELETEISELRTELETARQKHPMWNAVKQAIRNRIQ
jgi:chromosome segregation ATPase